jgi:cytochrome c-type biogenesis protein CcmI
MASALLFLLLALSTLAYIGYPLLRKSQRRLENVSDEHEIELSEEHERVYRELEDLEFEYECGKVSDEDYQQLRQELLATIELESATSARAAPKQPSKDSIEAEIARYKARKHKSR